MATPSSGIKSRIDEYLEGAGRNGELPLAFVGRDIDEEDECCCSREMVYAIVWLRRIDAGLCPAGSNAAANSNDRSIQYSLSSPQIKYILSKKCQHCIL